MRLPKVPVLSWLSCLMPLALLAACGGGGGEHRVEQAFTTLDRSQNSGLITPSRQVIRSADAWATLWAGHVSPRLPPPALPAVDFSREEVIAVFAGSQPNGCHAVEIQEVSDGGLERRVIVRASTPPAGAICTQQVVNPAHLIRLPATALVVSFRDR